jgi:hypothetical protein
MNIMYNRSEIWDSPRNIGFQLVFLQTGAFGKIEGVTFRF